MKYANDLDAGRATLEVDDVPSDVVPEEAWSHVVGRFAQGLVLDEQSKGAVEGSHVLEQLRIAPVVERVLGDSLEITDRLATDRNALG